MQAASKFILSFAVALTLGAFSAGNASAQGVAEPRTTDQATVPTADAQAFIGDWSLPLTGDQPIELQISIVDNAGNVGATVTAMGEPSTVTSITKAGEDLVLAYTLDLGGQAAPLSIKLTPTPAGTLLAVLDVADGMFTATGTATKK